MIVDLAEIAPNRLAAILYRPRDDVDTLLAEFAACTGDRGTTLLCEREVIEGWWRDLSSRIAHTRAADRSGPFSDHHVR